MKPQALTPDQLAWCKEKMPAFARSIKDRTNADESAAVSNAVARGIYPGEAVGIYTEPCPTLAALSPRQPLRPRLADRSHRQGTGERV